MFENVLKRTYRLLYIACGNLFFLLNLVKLDGYAQPRQYNVDISKALTGSKLNENLVALVQIKTGQT
jgi:hypothetical protein